MDLIKEKKTDLTQEMLFNQINYYIQIFAFHLKFQQIFQYKFKNHGIFTGYQSR
jgi:hypothetical protein